MKQFFTFIICIAITTVAMAQMPKAINYQAVARNNSGQALVNQAIKVRLSIVNTLAGNATLYSETRDVTTNALGLFNVQIGAPGATATTGDFATISWPNNTSNSKSLKVELDINNSGAFTDMGMQSLVSVPFAFAADKAIDAINIGGHYVYTNTPGVGNVLKWDGSGWKAEPEVANTHPKIYNLNGSLIGINVPGGSFSFVMPENASQIVVLGENQVVTSTISAVLGSSAGTVTQLGVAICFQEIDAQNNPTGVVQSLYPNTYSTVASISARTLVTVTGTVTTLIPGRYRIGLGFRNPSAVALNNSEMLTGFIMVSNK